MNQQPKTVQTIVLIAILALVLVVISSSLLTQNSGRLAYSDVLDLFETERVESFVLQGDTLTMTLYGSGTEQAGTAAAKIGDIETFHKDLDETIAAQSASGILKSYNYLPAVPKCPALRDFAIRGASITSLKTFSEKCSFEIILFILLYYKLVVLLAWISI